MPSQHADRNLLFAILSLQMDFVDRDELIRAMNDWMIDKSKSLAEILQTRGVLTSDDRGVLEALVARHVARHGSPQASLAVMDPRPAAQLREGLENPPADLQQSLALVGKGAAGDQSATPALHSQHRAAETMDEAPRPSHSDVGSLARTDAMEVGDFTVGASDQVDFDSGVEQSSIVRRRVGGATIVTFGDYRLHEQLGRGGMGVVFRATQLSLKRVVALKMIRSGELCSEAEVERFRTEAEAAARLDHPNIVPVHEIGEHRGQRYFSMGFVQGSTLAALVANGPLVPLEAAQLIEQIAGALQHAHDRGIVHRDLKPGNILLQQADSSRFIAKAPSSTAAAAHTANAKPANPGIAWLPKVADFGLAKRIDSADGMTQTGDILGTPGYMSPEQAAGRKEIGFESDIYSLGAVLYQCLTGRPPFQAASPMQTLAQVLETEPVAVRSLNPTVSRDLETICHKCLQKEPSKRYRSASELGSDLNRFLNGEPILARPVGRGERAWRWCRRHPLEAGLLVAVFLSLAVGAAVASVYAVSANAWAERAESEATHAKESELLARQAKAEAERAAVVAQKAEEDARVERDRADVAATSARRSALDSMRRAYGSNLLLACKEWEQGDKEKAAARLANLASSLGDRLDDIQSIEWDIWRKRLATIGSSYVAGNVWLTDIAIAPHSAHFFTGASDGAVKVWQMGRSQPIDELRGHRHMVNGISISKDGRYLASASHDKTVRIWDMDGHRDTGIELVHDNGVHVARFHPGGEWLITATIGGRLYLWDWRRRNVVAKFHQEEACNDADFSPDGKWLAHVGHSGRIYLRSGKDFADLATLQADHSPSDRVRFHPREGTLAHTSYSRDVIVWDLKSKRILRRLTGQRDVSVALAISADGSLVASGGRDRTVRVWHYATGALVATYYGHRDTVMNAQFSADDRRLLTCSQDGTVREWPIRIDDREMALLNVDSEPLALAATRDGARIFAGHKDGSLSVWDTGTWRQTRRIAAHAAQVTCLAASADGTILASAGMDGQLCIWDPTTGVRLAQLRRPQGHVHGLAFDPTDQQLASVDCKGGVQTFDRKTKQFDLLQHDIGRAYYCISSNAEGFLLGGSGGIHQWHGSQRTFVWPANGDADPFVAIVCDSKSGRLAAHQRSGRIMPIRLQTAASRKNAIVDKATACCLSADGRRYIVGLDDSSIRFIDVESGDEIWQADLQNKFARVRRLLADAAGQFVAAACSDNAIRVWTCRKMEASDGPFLTRRWIEDNLAAFRTKAEMTRDVASGVASAGEARARFQALARMVDDPDGLAQAVLESALQGGRLRSLDSDSLGRVEKLASRWPQNRSLQLALQATHRQTPDDRLPQTYLPSSLEQWELMLRNGIAALALVQNGDRQAAAALVCGCRNHADDHRSDPRWPMYAAWSRALDNAIMGSSIELGSSTWHEQVHLANTVVTMIGTYGVEGALQRLEVTRNDHSNRPREDARLQWAIAAYATRETLTHYISPASHLVGHGSILSPWMNFRASVEQLRTNWSKRLLDRLRSEVLTSAPSKSTLWMRDGRLVASIAAEQGSALQAEAMVAIAENDWRRAADLARRAASANLRRQPRHAVVDFAIGAVAAKHLGKADHAAALLARTRQLYDGWRNQTENYGEWLAWADRVVLGRPLVPMEAEYDAQLDIAANVERLRRGPNTIDEIVANLAADNSLDDVARSKQIAVARTHDDDAWMFARAAFEIGRSSNRTAPEYSRALGLAQTAQRLAPKDADVAQIAALLHLRCGHVPLAFNALAVAAAGHRTDELAKQTDALIRAICLHVAGRANEAKLEIARVELSIGRLGCRWFTAALLHQAKQKLGERK